jgi:hypothetical protein
MATDLVTHYCDGALRLVRKQEEQIDDEWLVEERQQDSLGGDKWVAVLQVQGNQLCLPEWERFGLGMTPVSKLLRRIFEDTANKCLVPQQQ